MEFWIDGKIDLKIVLFFHFLKKSAVFFKKHVVNDGMYFYIEVFIGDIVSALPLYFPDNFIADG